MGRNEAWVIWILLGTIGGIIGIGVAAAIWRKLDEQIDGWVWKRIDEATRMDAGMLLRERMQRRVLEKPLDTDPISR